MKKSLSLLLFFFFGLSFYQCIDCNCPPVSRPYFNIIGYTVDHLDKDSKILTDNSSIKSEDYKGFRMSFILSYISEAIKKQNTSFPINSLLACSCLGQGYLGSKDEKIEEINFITLYDFDKTHPAGSSINEYVQSLDLTGGLQNLQNYKGKTNITLETIDFGLFIRPEYFNSKLKIEVQLKLKEGESYAIQTPEITIY